MPRLSAPYKALPLDAEKMAMRLAYWLETTTLDAMRDMFTDYRHVEARYNTTQKLLEKMTREIGLSNVDIVQIKLFIERYRANVPKTEHLTTFDQIMHATYISQAIQFDQPLHKKVWFRYMDSQWSEFIQEMMLFCHDIDFHFDVSLDDYNRVGKELAALSMQFPPPAFANMVRRNARPAINLPVKVNAGKRHARWARSKRFLSTNDAGVVPSLYERLAADALSGSKPGWPDSNSPPCKRVRTGLSGTLGEPRYGNLQALMSPAVLPEEYRKVPVVPFVQ